MLKYRLLAIIVVVAIPIVCRARSNCDASFVKYSPSTEELDWIRNVELYQKDVCKHLPNETIVGFIEDIASVNQAHSKQKKKSSVSKYISHYIYNITCPDARTRTVAVPIEGIIGLARDPRKCWDVNNEEFTNSKAYVVPLTKRISTMFGNEGGKNILFDAGATYYLDAYSSSMKWFVDTYEKHGIVFDKIVAWEKQKLTEKEINEGVPSRLKQGGFEFYNRGIEVCRDCQHNPLTMIKKYCKKNDFVVFKLDIDSKDLENALVDQLLSDKEAMDLIDEFYYEEHFNNPAMHIHGWMRYSTTLADYYRLVIAQRRKGFRMHYWP